MRGWLMALLAAGFLVPSTGIAQDRRAPAEREAVVINELGLSVRELYVRPSTATQPGADRLGQEMLPPGGTFRLRLGRDATCRFDITAVLADNATEEKRGVDLCRTPRVTLGDTSLPLREAAIINDSDLILQEIYAAPPGAASRGPDRLGSEVVADGTTWRLRLGRTRDCVFDITAVMADGSEVSRPRTDVCRAPRVSLADPATSWREAVIVNSAGRELVALNAVPAGRGEGGNWGTDRLRDDAIPDGARWRLRLRLPGCTADLRATYEDDKAEEKRGVDLCREGTVTFDGSGIPRPPDRPVTIVNRHGARLEEVYISSTTEGDWGPERIPGGVGRSERRELTLPLECAVDVRVVFGNGAAEERREVDICAAAVIVVRPGWTIAARLDEETPQGARPGPQPGSLRVRNAASLPIVELFVDPPGAPRGADRLGATVLGVNETLDLAPPEGAGCPARLVAILRDGREIVKDGVDLCAGVEMPLE
ncbi:hypothetical protein [Muricoccus radiodurans]|uniref:hypothetical protein n=1 Tax=Muricoccus radiodurans TaxID=2231721 RepID=UPI003CECA1E7